MRKGGDRHKGRGRFIKGGVETPLHTMKVKLLVSPFVEEGVTSSKTEAGDRKYIFLKKEDS